MVNAVVVGGDVVGGVAEGGVAEGVVAVRGVVDSVVKARMDRWKWLL